MHYNTKYPLNFARLSSKFRKFEMQAFQLPVSKMETTMNSAYIILQ